MSQKIGKSGAVFLSAMLISVGVFGAVNLLEATPPTADAGVDQIVEPNIAVQFDGSSSIGDNLDYTWYFRTNGDVGAGMNPTHTFTEEGIYEVGLLVRETASSIMDLDITKITVRNQIPGADAGPDQVVNEDDIVTFDASGTTDTDSDLLGLIYDWDFADGAKGTGMNPTHVYTLAGTYTVILTVTDDGSAVGTDTVTITVNNLAPIANAGSDQTVNEGEYVYFDGSGSTDTPSDADSLRYEWNFGDLGPYAANYWKDNGVYPATLTVTDDDGAQNQNTIDVSVQNVDPFICVDDAYLIANITLCASGEKWHDVKFYLNESGTPREEFYVYREAGDPKEQEDTRDNIKLNLGELWTAEVYYTPLDDPLNGQLQGDTPVWIILEFDNGVTRKISHNFNVNHPETWYWNFALNDYFFQNPQPAIHFGYTVYDPGMDSETVTWECGGNTVSKYYEASTFPTLIKDTIDYTPKKMENITITVDDDDGGSYNVTLAFSESSMLDGLSPKVSAGDNQSAIEDDPVTFSGSANTTVSRSISSYQWEFGDGASASGATANHIYRFSGTYYVVLRAWDDLGNVGIDIVKVEIINANPTAEAGLDKVAAEDSIVIFDGSGTTDTLSDISSLVYEWNFGDGSDGYGISPIHVYSNAGTYSVTLTVTDNDGATSTDTLVITVNNLAPTSALAGPDRIIYGASMSIEFVGVGFDTFSDVLGLVYNWNFGDGTPGTGKVTSHTYIVASTYTITLTVTDDNNAVATDTCTIFVGIDSDGDNLVDTFETGIGTDVDNWDSDTDYISDYWEIYTYDTDPALSDTDVDGLIDWYEIAYLGYDVDVDDDGLMCPRDWDSDGDWIKDGDDPNPLMYNYADGTEASGPVVISVNEYLGVYVVIEYEGVSTVKANIVEITPIKELNIAVGHYVDISTTSTVPFTAEIRFKYSMPLPPPTLEEQLALYQWHGANNKWVIEDNTVVDVDKDFVWSKVTHFCELCIGNSNFQYSDNDGLCDWYERNTYHPNFSDDLAYLNGKTNEFIDDTDGDGLYDGWEDLNGDGIFDDGETKGEVQYYTSPLNADTDDDDVNDNIDIDPLVDLQVTVKINEILRLDPVDDWPNEGADFYLWIICNDGNSEQMLKLPDRTDRDAFEEDSDHVYPDASATFDVVDDSELVGFMIILFDDDGGLDRTLDDTMASGDDPCDISSRPGGGGGDPNNWGYSALLLNYDLKIGQWSMEDSPGDANGYGHASGNEDGSIGTSGADDQNDCELNFTIKQNDCDDDTVTYWEELNVYDSDPTSSSSPGWIGYFISEDIYVDILYPNSIFSKYLERIEIHADRKTKTFEVEGSANHISLRDKLSDEYNNGMRGAVFVGRLPFANYYFGSDFFPISPIDQYYSQLDWSWFDTNNDGYYDSYSFPGTQPDDLRTVWIGQLRPPVTDLNLQIELLENYFQRGIQYMNLQSPCTDGAFLCNAVNLGTRWDHIEGVKYAYPYNILHDGITNSEFIEMLIDCNYEYIHITGHGDDVNTGIGGFSVGYLEIKNNPGQTHFYWLDSCFNGRYSSNNYIAGWFTFSKGGQALGTIASTTTSPVLLDTPLFYNLFNQEIRIINGYQYYGNSIGDMLKFTFAQNRPLGFTYIGDPLLKSWRA